MRPVVFNAVASGICALVAPPLEVAESERCFWLETWAAEICTVLLASLLGQVDVAVFRDRNMFIPRLPHHAQRSAWRLLTLRLFVNQNQ